MKASEAKPLTKEELQTLQQLFQRWILITYPYNSGSSEESDAFQTYINVESDAKRGRIKTEGRSKEDREYMAKYGENEL